MEEIFFQHNTISIHTILTKSEYFNFNKSVLIVCIPGLLNDASDMYELLAEKLEFPTLFVSLRGRGKSSSPSSGYTFEEQLDDLIYVFDNICSNVDNVFIIGYSVGVSFTIKLAKKYSKLVKGVILCDYPPIYPQLTEKWLVSVNEVEEFVPIKKIFEPLLNDSKLVVCSSELEELECGVMLLHGSKENGSLVSQKTLDYYDRVLSPSTKDKNIILYREECGHDVLSSNTTNVEVFINRFLEGL